MAQDLTCAHSPKALPATSHSDCADLSNPALRLDRTFVAGAIGSGLIFPLADSSYLVWGDPAITNATFLFTPFIGAVIDRFGFRAPALLVLLSVRVMLAT